MISNIKNLFFDAIENGRILHACFIACLDTHESYAVAKTAAALFCTKSADVSRLENCPDFFQLGDEDYSVQNVRELLKTLAKQPYSDDCGRAIILKDAHMMNEASQNALLKTLEEPPERTLFLLTGNESGLLPTIRSRCSMIRLGVPSFEKTKKMLMDCGALEKEAMLYTSIGECLFERAYRLFNDENFRELREASITVLVSFLEGKLPFDSLKPLSQNKSAFESVNFMLSFMKDMLNYKITKNVSCNADKLSIIATLCERFTIGKINSIINIMTDAKSRLTISAVHAPVIDRMFAKISEET